MIGCWEKALVNGTDGGNSIGQKIANAIVTNKLIVIDRLTEKHADERKTSMLFESLCLILWKSANE